MRKNVARYVLFYCNFDLLRLELMVVFSEN